MNEPGELPLAAERQRKQRDKAQDARRRYRAMYASSAATTSASDVKPGSGSCAIQSSASAPVEAEAGPGARPGAALAASAKL